MDTLVEPMSVHCIQCNAVNQTYVGGFPDEGKEPPVNRLCCTFRGDQKLNLRLTLSLTASCDETHE